MTVFFTNTYIKGHFLRKAAHMPPFTFVTASGLVKPAGSNPPGFPGRNSGQYHGRFGVFFYFFLFSLYKSVKKRYNIC